MKLTENTVQNLAWNRALAHLLHSADLQVQEGVEPVDQLQSALAHCVVVLTDWGQLIAGWLAGCVYSVAGWFGKKTLQ